VNEFFLQLEKEVNKEIYEDFENEKKEDREEI
jgi:hypothetical protein